MRYYEFKQSLTEAVGVKTLKIGDIRLDIDMDHLMSQMFKRAVGHHQVDRMLKILPSLLSKIADIEPGQQFWIWNSDERVGLGFRKLNNSPKLILKTAISSPPKGDRNPVINMDQSKPKLEDYNPNGTPPGPEFKPTMPKGTVKVDVSDVYDWYKLGQHISNLKGLGKHDFGKGPPSTILSFGDEDTEHEYIQDLEKTGLSTTDIDPIDPKQPKGMKRQKLDPTYNVNEVSGYIPSEKEKNDPRFKTALTKDVRPDSIQRNAKAFGFKTSRAGIPPLLRK